MTSLLQPLFLILTFCFPFLGGEGFAVKPVIPLLILLLPIALSSVALMPGSRVLLLFFLWSVVSSFYGYVFLNVPIAVGDFMEMIRLLLSCVVIWAGRRLSSVWAVEKQLGWIVVFIAVIGLIQYSNIDGGLLAKIYSADSQIDAVFGVGMDYKRLVFTLGNPNDAGLFFCFLSVLFCSVFLVEKKIDMLVFLGVSVICMLFTQSKTAIFSSFTGVLLLLLFNGMYYQVCLFFLMVAAVFVGFGEKMVYVWNFLQGAYDGGVTDVHVFAVRFENAVDALAIWEKSPIFGWGVAKNIHPTVVDVEYALILRRFGLVGLLLIFGFLLDVFLQVSGKSGCLRKKAYANFLAAAVFLIPIFMLSNNFINSYYNHFLFLFLFGCYLKMMDDAVEMDVRIIAGST